MSHSLLLKSLLLRPQLLAPLISPRQSRELLYLTGHPFIAHHVVDILPVVEGDELEGGEHGPEQVVKAGEPVVGVAAYAAQAGVAMRTGPAHFYTSTCSSVHFWFQ